MLGPFIETRATNARERPEIRSTGGRRTIGGYAAVFRRYSRDLGGFVEEVTDRAFGTSQSAGWPEVIARYNHSDAMLLGTSDAGTLDLAVDARGLAYEVDPPRHRADVVELIERGDVRKSSFAFRLHPGGDEWALNEQGYPLRRLLSVALVDVAPVNTPAYVDTSAARRSLADYAGADLAEIEQASEVRQLHRFISRRRPAVVVDLGSAARRRLAQLEAKRLDPSVPAPRLGLGPALSGTAALALLERCADPWEVAV